MTGWAAARRHGCVTQDTGLLQTLFILRPQILLIDTEKVQVIPREDAAVVAIAERRLHAVIAHRLQAEYADMAFTGPCPCTSADGLKNRNNSKGKRNDWPLSNDTSKVLEAPCNTISVG